MNSFSDGKSTILVSTKINAPLQKVWSYWNDPNHITQWYFASDEWHAPNAENDLQIGGKFKTRMEAKDGSFGFDFAGTYTSVIPEKEIQYALEDGRKVKNTFSEEEGKTVVTQTFEPEKMNAPEMQKTGWQAILDNFKKYTESLNG